MASQIKVKPETYAHICCSGGYGAAGFTFMRQQHLGRILRYGFGETNQILANEILRSPYFQPKI